MIWLAAIIVFFLLASTAVDLVLSLMDEGDIV